ncbi:MAG: ring-cleaving dioxygenase [Armatimonadota bacterium]|nr:ring-cleaving dioxygenase [Armatimonadota bacterium]MDR7536891.1 ring-cleaving dioxygenase [Armatimonadota bacterium]
MDPQILGIHHVTAIASDPQANLDFYAGVLGLRLVKRTVNFDDPGTYHLYYGDGVGTPGTLMTFFPWPGAPRGQVGAGMVSATAFAIPPGALPFWQARLRAHGVIVEEPGVRFDGDVLTFTDPDGLPLELVTDGTADDARAWTGGPVPPQAALRGVHSVTLTVAGLGEDCGSTRAVLERLGWQVAAQVGARTRYVLGAGGPGATLDLVCAPAAPRGQYAAGTVHHVAWRTPDDAHQSGWRERVREAGLDVTPVQDRQYFRSIYFREPGGVLFEIATDPPGFTVDESPEMLGSGLRLPPWLEPMRPRLERTLPPLRSPEVTGRG